eukprot:2726373-Pleurochrysis_carterae.AAC.1
MDFLNAVGVHNDTIMVVESHNLEVHRAAKSSMDWSSGGAQFHSPTLHAFLDGLYNNANKDDVISAADHVHRCVRYQLALSEKLLMPNTCVPPIHTTAPGTPDWWAAFKRTILEIRADVGEHGLDSVMLMIAELDVNAAMNAPVSQEDTAVALMKWIKHAFEVPRLLHDPGLASAMRTAPLNFNVV